MRPNCAMQFSPIVATAPQRRRSRRIPARSKNRRPLARLRANGAVHRSGPDGSNHRGSALTATGPGSTPARMDDRQIATTPGRTWTDAFDSYEGVLRSIVERYPAPELLELGGGRWPGFRLNQMPPNTKSYTVNDLNEDELARLPPGYDKACFDVSGDSAGFESRYDVVFSRFLGEHVRDGLAMHRNVHRVLKPGGTAFHLIPTLYALPFVMNRLLPERLGQKILSIVAPSRDISPKFPAYYSWCHGNTAAMRRMFRDVGYSKVEIINYYGHFYYDKIPVVRTIERNFRKLAARKNWSWCASFAYIIAHK